MKKAIFISSFFFLGFINETKAQCAIGSHMTDFTTINHNLGGKGHKIEIGHNAITNTDYILVANFRTSSAPGTEWLSRYNFQPGNADVAPTFDTSFNVPDMICKMLDLDIYDENGNAFVSFFSSNLAGTGLRHISNTGVMTSFPYPPHTNSAYNNLFRANSIACDASNHRVFCAFHVPAQSFQLSYDNRIVIIREYQLDATNPAIVLSTRDYLISETEVVGIEDANTFYNDPVIEILNDGNLLLSFAVYSPTFSSSKVLSIFTGEDPNDMDSVMNSDDFSITHQYSSCNGIIRDVEVNLANNDIYLAGSFSSPSSYAARLNYDVINGITSIANFAPNFYYSGGAYATSISFLPNCNRLVVGSSGNMKSIPNTYNPGKFGNLFLMDASSGLIDESFTSVYKLNTSISTTAQLEDVALFSGSSPNNTLSNSIFIVGQQTSTLPDLNYVSRICLGDAPLVSANFDYCKTTNSDGSYNVQITSNGGNFTYTLNGNSITDLTNLNGTLVITNSVSQDCSSLISCYQETISNGANCSQLDKMSSPQKKNTLTQNHKKDLFVQGKSVIVYPNPSDGIFTIRGNFDLKQSVTIDVFDLKAKTVFKKTIDNFNNEGEAIDMRSIASGTYIISLKQGDSKITQTIIKE